MGWVCRAPGLSLKWRISLGVSDSLVGCVLGWVCRWEEFDCFSLDWLVIRVGLSSVGLSW